MTSTEQTPPGGGQTGGQQIVKLLLELGPLVVFFLVNGQRGIFWGTGAFVIATVIALAASWVMMGRVPTMPLVSGVFIVVFGGLTLWLHDELFIKMKPTIVNGLFAAILFGGLACGHSLLRHLFGEAFSLSEPGWRILTFRWACFFVALAILNEVVWRNVSTEAWISFKLFAIMPLTIVFMLFQVGLLRRYGADRAPE